MAVHLKSAKISIGGFTLLELLVSITILALIVTISYSALRLGARSWDASINNINMNADKRSAIALIKSKIEHAYPIFWEVNTKQILAFQGRGRSLKFIAPSPQGRELGEYFEYYFVIDEASSGMTLTLFYEPHDPSFDDFTVDESSPNRVLLEGLKDAQFAYYGKSASNREEDWFAEWHDDSINLPYAIQLVLKEWEGESEREFEMVVKVQSELFSL